MWRRIAQAQRRQSQQSAISFQGFPHGLNTSVPATQIRQTECAALINFKINRGGQLESRSPITKYNLTATTSNSPVKAFIRAPIGGTNYELLVDANYKLYYNNSGTLTLIGTLEGDAEIVAYNGVAILMDGSYLKYLDGISNIKIAYDDGTGTSGYQFRNSAGSDDSNLALGNGTNTRIAYKFTSQTFTAGYTIPPTTVTAKLSKNGNGYTGTDDQDVIIKIRLVADNSVLATRTLVAAPLNTNVSDTATEYSTTFVAGDIANELSPNVSYYFSVEYANGDASHYIKCHCTDVAAGGLGYHYTGSWSADTDKNPIMSLRPGMPPKATFGTVSTSRLFLGGDPDNPGYIWYSNLTHLDWSTSDGGGYVGAVDENKNNYEIGAIVNLYAELYVFGTQAQPYLCKLTGTSPTDYALPVLFQRVWATHKTAMSVINDIFFTSEDGADAISGVTEYGDLRTFSASDPIYNRIIDNWITADAFAAYYPIDGQYMLCMPGHHRVLVSHVKIPTTNPEQVGVRYAWAEYELYLHELTSSVYKWTLKSGETDIYRCEIAAGGDPSFDVQPDVIIKGGQKCTNQAVIGNLEDHQWFYGDDDTLGYDTVYFKDATGDPDTSGIILKTVLVPSCFGNFCGEFFIGGNDGYIYKLDSSDYKDQSIIHVDSKFASAYITMPFTSANLTDMQIIASSKGGASVSAKFYTNGAEAHDLVSYALDVYDGLTVDEAMMDVDDALFLVESSTAPLFKKININAWSFQIYINDVVLTGWPLYVNGMMVKFRPLRI